MMTRLFGWLACAGAVALLVVAMVTGTGSAVAAATAAESARVTATTVRLAVVPGRPAAGYFTLTAGASPVELTAVTSPLARIELHGMAMARGVMRMEPLPRVRVAAGQVVRFAPGGSHLMLFDVAASVRPGTTLPLTFVFTGGARVRVDAAVTAGGDATAMPAVEMPMPPAHGAR